MRKCLFLRRVFTVILCFSILSPNYRINAESMNQDSSIIESLLEKNGSTKIDEQYNNENKVVPVSMALPPEDVVSAVYGVTEIEVPIAIKEIQSLSLQRKNQKNVRRSITSVNERITDLSRGEIEELALAGASIEDVYWINLIVKESLLTPINVLEIKRKEKKSWIKIESQMFNNDLESSSSVKEIVYQDEFNTEFSLKQPITVKDDVYDQQKLDGKLNLSFSTEGISGFDSIVNSVFYGLATQQQINQANKQQYSDRSTSSELIDPASGALTWKENEISLPGRDGLDLNIGLMYNSNQSFAYMRDYESSGQIKKYNYLISRYDLGIGWSFQFPSVQLADGYMYYHDGQGAIYRIDFNGNDDLSSYSHLVGYQGKDIQFLQDNGTFSNGTTSSSYYLQHTDKKREYFASDGLLLGIVDRFGNRIKFEHIERQTYDGKTNKVISTITDSLDRKILFSYESNLNTTNTFNGENIVVSVLDKSGNEAQKVTLTKWRNTLTFNGTPDGYMPFLWKVQDQIGQETWFDYDSSVSAKFNYIEKEANSNAGYNSFHRLVGVHYPISTTNYQYELVTRNLGIYGFGEEYRIKSRNDVAKNTYNQIDYTYSGDYTGYSTHSDPNNLPETYMFSSTATVHSTSAANGLATTTQFNGLQQNIATISQAQNGERKENRNISFHSVFKFLPLRVVSAEFAVGDNESTANTLYSDITYTDWGGVESQTQPLTLSQINDPDTKNKYMTSLSYEPIYHFIKTKSWYQNASTNLIESYEYYASGRIKSYTNPQNEITNYQYGYEQSFEGKITSIYVEKKLKNGFYSRTETVFGAESNYAYPTEINKKFTNVPKYGYDSPAQIQKTMKYDIGSGNLKEETIDGKTTQYTYDLLGRIKTIAYPAITNQAGEIYDVEDQYDYVTGSFSSSLFDSENQYLSMLRVNSKRKYTQRSNGGITYLSNQNQYYDGFGLLRMDEIIDTGAKTHYHVDDLARTVYVKDSVDNDTTVKYDAWGQQNELKDNYGNIYISEHSLKLRKETKYMVEASKVEAYRQTNEASLKSSYVEQNYDQWGNLLFNVAFKNWPLQSESSKIFESYSYDFVGNVMTYTDPNNNKNNDGVTTNYSYDKLNRLIAVKNSLNQITSYQYDGSGQVTNITMKDSISGETDYIINKSYNELGLLYEKNDNSSGISEARTYNQLGLLAQTIDRKNTVFSYQYDERNQIVSTLISGAGGKTQQIKGVFGSDGILIDSNELYHNGVKTSSETSTIDSLKRVTTISSKSTTMEYNASTSYIYDKGNRITRAASTQNGMGNFYINYQYSKQRLEKVQTNGNAATNTAATVNATYEYYPTGKVKSITYPTLADGTHLRTEYEYNSLNQLRTLINSKDSSILSSFSYLYDNNGNITTVTENLSDGTSKATTYSYDPLNRIKDILPSDGGETISYSYDLRGNRQSVSGISSDQLKTANIFYTYDLQNTLTEVTKGNSSTSINYLPSGLRYQKTSDTIKTQYNYNGNGEVISETKSNGEKANYIRGDRLLVKKDVTSAGTKDYYYLYNGHGDVVQIVDTSGKVLNSYSYDIWGNITNQEEEIPNSFKYAGEIYDEESGLYYLRARYYDPSTGRFLNEDTYEGQINNPLSLNLYTYVENNPLIYIDPTGNAHENSGYSGPPGGSGSYSVPKWALTDFKFLKPKFKIKPTYVKPKLDSSNSNNQLKSETNGIKTDKNTIEPLNRVYKPSDKHDPKSGWGSPNPIPDSKTGQELLDGAYSSSKNKQLYNIYDGKLIKFQPDSASDWHPYEVVNPAKEVPADVLRQMFNDGKITKVEYNKMIKNKK